MRLTLLGSGDSAGMPWYGCDCARCRLARTDPAYRRGPACALLEVAGQRYLIDAGLLDIAERFDDTGLDGILLTHFHPDHVQGLFHLRWGTGEKIPVYCPPDSTGCADLYKHPGILDFQVQSKYKTFTLAGLNITPLPLIHSKPTFGYLIDNGESRIAYLTDTKGLPPKVEGLLTQTRLNTLVIDTCLPPGVLGRNHNSLDDTLLLQQRLGAEKLIMTHIGHDLDVWLHDHPDALPQGLIAAYDGCIAFA